MLAAWNLQLILKGKEMIKETGFGEIGVNNVDGAGNLSSCGCYCTCNCSVASGATASCSTSSTNMEFTGI